MVADNGLTGTDPLDAARAVAPRHDGPRYSPASVLRIADRRSSWTRLGGYPRAGGRPSMLPLLAGDGRQPERTGFRGVVADRGGRVLEGTRYAGRHCFAAPPRVEGAAGGHSCGQAAHASISSANRVIIAAPPTCSMADPPALPRPRIPVVSADGRAHAQHDARSPRSPSASRAGIRKFNSRHLLSGSAQTRPAITAATPRPCHAAALSSAVIHVCNGFNEGVILSRRQTWQKFRPSHCDAAVVTRFFVSGSE